MNHVIDNTTVEIVLAGRLGKTYGKVHRLVAATPAKAVRLLMLIPGFKADLIRSAQAGMSYQLIVDKKRGVSEKELRMPIGGKRMLITAVPAGQKGGIGGILETVAGVVLIVVASFMTDGAAAAYAPAVLGAGVSLAAGGITSLLTTLPKSTNAGSGDTLSSFYFNGASNTQQQGSAVPVVYGRMLIGSQAIGASMDAVDLANAPAETGNLT